MIVTCPYCGDKTEHDFLLEVFTCGVCDEPFQPASGLVRLYCGDCLNVMAGLASHSIDLVIADLPYGTTQNRWDSVLPLEALWSAYDRVCKPQAAIVLTASQPFSSMLVASKPKLFRHEWVWIKNRGSNFANTVREPMKEHESVLVFSFGGWTYNKQMQPRTGGGADRVRYRFSSEVDQNSDSYGVFASKRTPALPEMRVPSSWQKFNCEVGMHPTQKPVALMEYLVRTYSNLGDTVLDNCMGSGTTGLACRNTGRRFIGIEMDPVHFQTAKDRLRRPLNVYQTPRWRDQMARFRMDNTEGYSQSDLDELNRRYEIAIAEEEPIPETWRDSHEKNVAERVLSEFDAGA